MASQVFLILLVGIVLSAALALAAAGLEQRQAEQRLRFQRLADRVVDLTALLEAQPSFPPPGPLAAGPESPRLVGADLPAGAPDPALTERLGRRLGSRYAVEAFLPDDRACRDRPPPPPPEHDRSAPPPPPPPPLVSPPRPPAPDCRLVRVTLTGGRRVALVFPLGPKAQANDHAPLTPIYLLILSLAAAILAYLVARMATAPLRRLSNAATALGRDLDRTPLVVEGPLEVRHAAAAFNLMQARLKSHVIERTQMLAAITHDLQTPMTRLRLRLERVKDRALRDQLLADHADMQALIRDGLDLARLSDEGEALADLDVDSLLQTLRDDAVADGRSVSIGGQSGLVIRTRPQTLRRCLGNLLDNALKYAGSAELSASDEGAPTLAVSDSGPGIPPDKLDAVLQPFRRLEESRSRDTGGVGLGLTIAKSMAERAGAELRIENRSEGGLRCSLVFPVGR